MAVLLPLVTHSQLAPVQRVPVATTPLVSIVIVNYRRWEETAHLVEQLLGVAHIHRDHLEIIIVDNASPRHPLEERLRSFERVRIVRLEQNCGFSAGVNAGFKLSKAPWLMVLNPDVVLCPGFADFLCAAVRDVDEDAAHGAPIGIVGFRLRNRDGTTQLSTGLFPSLSRMILGLLKPRKTRKYIVPNGTERQKVPWVTGSCMLIRRECMTQLEGFDESYFLYYEDVDLCRRAMEKGWAVCYEPMLEAVHLDPLQNRPLTEPMRAITRHASLTYFRKHLSGWQFWGLAQIIRTEAVLRQTWLALRGRTQDARICKQLRRLCTDLLQHQPRTARARLQRVLEIAGMTAPTNH
jgi:GT2 family glycosyltransferase